MKYKVLCPICGASWSLSFLILDMEIADIEPI